MKNIEEMTNEELKDYIDILEKTITEKEKDLSLLTRPYKDLDEAEQVRVAREYAREHNISFYAAVERLANEL